MQDIPGDPNDAAIATTIIAMGHVLSLRVLAEGVENSAQLDFLKSKGWDEVQGFLLGRPVPRRIHSSPALRRHQEPDGR